MVKKSTLLILQLNQKYLYKVQNEKKNLLANLFLSNFSIKFTEQRKKYIRSLLKLFTFISAITPYLGLEGGGGVLKIRTLLESSRNANAASLASRLPLTSYGWDSVTAEPIKNCFKYCGFRVPEDSEIQAGETQPLQADISDVTLLVVSSLDDFFAKLDREDAACYDRTLRSIFFKKILPCLTSFSR